jgi:hypothetical protein
MIAKGRMGLSKRYCEDLAMKTSEMVAVRTLAPVAWITVRRARTVARIALTLVSAGLLCTAIYLVATAG